MFSDTQPKGWSISPEWMVSITGISRSGHNHCALPAESYPEVQAFIDKFLFGNTSANTNIRVHEFDNVDYNKWISAWKKP